MTGSAAGAVFMPPTGEPQAVKNSVKTVSDIAEKIFSKLFEPVAVLYNMMTPLINIFAQASRLVGPDRG